ncbi:MAG: guanylate kinase [Prolixibacteraceae bacterium]|nr:guanylate kinase [Prolixibacteraceae bacterium]
MKGKLIIFSAPSGSGKTTIIRHILSQGFPLEFSVSATSRHPRQGEKHGKDYYFLSENEFLDKIKNNEFLEYEEVYDGLYYGTLRSEVEKKREQGKNIIFDVDVIGGLNIKKIYRNDALAIFIKPPSAEELENRLKKRSTETPEKISMRIARAEKEIKFAEKFDVIVVNDILEDALLETEKIIDNFLNKKPGCNE